MSIICSSLDMLYVFVFIVLLILRNILHISCISEFEVVVLLGYTLLCLPCDEVKLTNYYLDLGKQWHGEDNFPKT